MKIYQTINNPIEKYEILTSIGQGAYSCVYSVRCKQTYKIYAMKKYTALFSNIVDTKNIIKELVLCRLLKSDCIPLVKEVFVNADELSDKFPFINTVYLVFEKCDFDLRRLMRNTSINLLNLKLILFQLVRSVKALHNQGICHRDIKPENILIIIESSIIKITDFNHSKIITNIATNYSTNFFNKSISHHIDNKQNTHIIGTRYYRAPELLLMESYNTKVDVWALGCVFLELIAAYSNKKSEPFFEGKSCELFSPTEKENIDPNSFGKRLISKDDQIIVILDGLGRQKPTVFDFIEKKRVRDVLREYNKKMCGEMAKLECFIEKMIGDERLADLLRCMLVFNPNSRFDIDKCYNHKYFDSIRDGFITLPELSPLKFDFDIECSRNLFNIEKQLLILLNELNSYNKLVAFDKVGAKKFDREFCM